MKIQVTPTIAWQYQAPTIYKLILPLTQDLQVQYYLLWWAHLFLAEHQYSATL